MRSTERASRTSVPLWSTPAIARPRQTAVEPSRGTRHHHARRKRRRISASIGRNCWVMFGEMKLAQDLERMMPSIALITGGNRGLGFAAARSLARKGVTVIVGARREPAARAAVCALRDEGFAADWVRLEVADAASVKSAAAVVRERHGRLDILVNNAGISPEVAAVGVHEFAGPDIFRRT